MKNHPLPTAAVLHFVSRGSVPAMVLGLALLGSPSVSAASTCSYGENFDFPAFTAGATSATGTMTNLDIDREPATVVVTNGNGGNLPSAVVGNQLGTAGENSDQFSPAIGYSITPPYGRGLQLTGVTDPLTFTFSKPMRNLVMHLRNGDNMLFTFTDGSGNPLEYTFHFASQFGALPTTGNGTSSAYLLKTAPNVLAMGENIPVSIAFKNPVTVLKMAQSYIGNTHPEITPLSLNTAASFRQINFGQFCDQPGVLDYCNSVNFAEWRTASYSASVNPDTFTGNVNDETGKPVSVTFTGGLSQAATIAWGGSTNAGSPPGGVEEGNIPLPYRPATNLISTSETVPAGNTITLTWTFGEEVGNPGLLIRGASSAVASPVNLKFYKADGVTPLPFLLRSPSAPDRNRQVDENTMYVASASGSTIQFTDSTTAIVLKATRVSGGGTFTFSTQSNVFMGCNGTLTASGSTIDSDSDGDGVPDLSDKCPNTPAGAVVGTDGCPLPTDLSIVKTASVSKITPGVPFTYTITVTNTGAEATNVKASDMVPAGLTINTATASDSGVVTQNGQDVQALWAVVPDGATRTLTISVTKP